MSSQQQQAPQLQQEQTQQRQSQQRRPSVEKQSENYTTDIQIIDIIAKIMADKTVPIEIKNKKIGDEKIKMAQSLIKPNMKNISKYIKTEKTNGITYYYLDMSDGKDKPKKTIAFDTKSQAEEAFKQVIIAHAKKVTEETFTRCKEKLGNTPEYLIKHELQAKKEEIYKQEAELRFQQTQLLSQKQSIDKQLIDSTTELQSKINLYNSSTQRTFDAAKTRLKMTESELKTEIKSQNDKNLVDAQRNTTEAIKKTGELIDKTMREAHDMTIAANVQNREAITSAIGETGRLIQISAEDAKKAAENASKSGEAIKFALDKVNEDIKKGASDAMTAAAEAKNLSEKQLDKQKEINAAVTAMNEAVVAASDKAEKGVTMLRGEIEKVGSELRDIKELLGNKLDTLAEAFKTDKTVEITPDILNGIFDNFLTCSAGFPWMMKKEYYSYPLHHTDNETLDQLEDIYSRNFSRTYTTPSSKDYLQCAGAYNNGEGRHKLSLYDFNTMLKMNGLPQIDWSDPNRNNGVYSRFGAVASESYIR